MNMVPTRPEKKTLFKKKIKVWKKAGILIILWENENYEMWKT